MQLAEPQDISSPPQSSTYGAHDSEYTVLESPTGELRISTDDVLRPVDGSVGGLDADRQSVARGHQSPARSYAEPDVHTHLAIEEDQSNQHAESSAPAEPSKATQIPPGVLSKDSTTQQILRNTEQGNADRAIDKDEPNKQSESSPSIEPPKTIKLHSTLQSEDSPTMKGLQNTEHGNDLFSVRKEWPLPAVNKWKKWVPSIETISRPEGDQQVLKADTGQILENSRAAPSSSTNQKAEATGHGEMLFSNRMP